MWYVIFDLFMDMDPFFHLQNKLALIMIYGSFMFCWIHFANTF